MADGGHLFGLRVRTNEHTQREDVQDWIEAALTSYKDGPAEFDLDEMQIIIEGVPIHTGKHFVDYRKE